jgi:two-component system OmpR family sensor kinase
MDNKGKTQMEVLMTIRLRLTLLYSAILTSTLLIFGAVLYSFLHLYVFNDFKKSLRQQTVMLEESVQYELALNPSGWNLTIQLDNFDTVQTGMYLQIINLVTGNMTKSGNLRNVELPFSTIDLSNKNGGYYATPKIGNSPFLVYNEPLLLNGQLVGVLQSAYNISVISKFFSILRLVLLVLSVIVITIAAIVGWFLSKKALKPVYSLIDATAKIQSGNDLGIRIQHEGTHDEIGLLSNTINGMLQRIQSVYGELDKLYESQRRFVGDASHELRTPLTSIKGNAELLKKLWTQLDHRPDRILQQDIELSVETINDITDESFRMGRLVNDLLVLARADVGIQIKKDEIEMEDIVESAIRKAQFLPRSAEFRTGNLEDLKDIHIIGDKDYLQQLILIFLENAFKFTPAGFVEITVHKSAGKIGLIICDSGIGMETDEISHIFERFYRADSSRGSTPGTGLGLSIAKWILDEHNATVEINSVKCKGTSFSIWFPVFIPLPDA